MLSYEIMLPEERKACSELAARAFASYEYFSIYVPDDKKRLRFLQAMMESEFKANADAATFMTAKEDGNIAAVAMLCDPNYKKPTDMAYMRAGFGKVFLRGGIKNVAAWNNMEAKASAPCHELAGGSWYLNLLTVDPAVEGRGIGTKMMQEYILPYMRKHGGKGLCLFTNSEINRQFYQKNGFEEFHDQSFTYKGRTIGSWSYRK